MRQLRVGVHGGGLGLGLHLSQPLIQSFQHIVKCMNATNCMVNELKFYKFLIKEIH